MRREYGAPLEVPTAQYLMRRRFEVHEYSLTIHVGTKILDPIQRSFAKYGGRSMKLRHLSCFDTIRTFFNIPLAVVGVVLLYVAPPTASAQSVTFASAQSTVGSGFY